MLSRDYRHVKPTLSVDDIIPSTSSGTESFQVISAPLNVESDIDPFFDDFFLGQEIDDSNDIFAEFNFTQPVLRHQNETSEEAFRDATTHDTASKNPSLKRKKEDEVQLSEHAIKLAKLFTRYDELVSTSSSTSELSISMDSSNNALSSSAKTDRNDDTSCINDNRSLDNLPQTLTLTSFDSQHNPESQPEHEPTRSTSIQHISPLQTGQDLSYLAPSQQLTPNSTCHSSIGCSQNSNSQDHSQSTWQIETPTKSNISSDLGLDASVHNEIVDEMILFSDEEETDLLHDLELLT
ncbi:hypothetical protein BKA69DRAFT_1077347 [Paraphysoderma sedebokerense]|nr:hypothetical protein BKA69DRAFT_1077347 [Paraphysoderma sedebokerense]